MSPRAGGILRPQGKRNPAKGKRKNAMNRKTRHPAGSAWSAFLLAVCAVAPGCQNKDAEHLAELGSRLAESVRNWAGPNGRPIRGLESVPLCIGELALD